MKAIILVITVFMIACSSSKQTESGLSRKEARELRKANKEAELRIQYDSIAKILDTRQFVIEANYLSNQRGRRVIVPSNLNFIKVDTSAIVMQIGFNSGFGYNGVGGITVEGTSRNWKVHKYDNKKYINIEMDVMSTTGIYNVFINVNAVGNASATISGIREGKLNYEGTFVALENSRVWKGQTTY